MLENQPSKEEILKAIKEGVADAFYGCYNKDVEKAVFNAFPYASEIKDTIYNAVIRHIVKERRCVKWFYVMGIRRSWPRLSGVRRVTSMKL